MREMTLQKRLGHASPESIVSAAQDQNFASLKRLPLHDLHVQLGAVM